MRLRFDALLGRVTEYEHDACRGRRAYSDQRAVVSNRQLSTVTPEQHTLSGYDARTFELEYTFDRARAVFTGAFVEQPHHLRKRLADCLLLEPAREYLARWIHESDARLYIRSDYPFANARERRGVPTLALAQPLLRGVA